MQTEEEIAAESALRENLKRKGTNRYIHIIISETRAHFSKCIRSVKSYYYAHGHGANGPEWDGKEQPRLLATAPIAAQEAEVKRTRVIESYSWMDGKKSVKILVDYENAGDVDDECLELVSFLALIVWLLALIFICNWSFVFLLVGLDADICQFPDDCRRL